MVAILYLGNHVAVWNDDHHAVAVSIVYTAGGLEIRDVSTLLLVFADAKKANRPAILEVVFYVIVRQAEYFNYQLVKRIVI